MPQNTTAITSFLVETCPSHISVDDNNVKTIQSDVEFMFFRLMQIDANSFAAFVRSARMCVDLTESMAQSLPPNVHRVIMSDILKLIKTDIISITAKSSEQGGKLLRDLQQDISTENHYLYEKSNNSQGGMFAKFRNGQGQAPQQPPQQQPPQVTA